MANDDLTLKNWTYKTLFKSFVKTRNELYLKKAN